MSVAAKLVLVMDEQSAKDADTEFRRHLGGSIIGHECSRFLWYTFHWAFDARPPGRIARLWMRGHREEQHIIALLRRVGAQVWERDADGKQFRVSDHNGHFGGSLDAVANKIPGVDPNELMLLEMKTYNDKRFNSCVAKGVRESEWKYYVQMMTYMKKRGLKWALFIAVNKNDDTLHAEFVAYDEMTANRYIERAGQVIAAPHPLPRINESPGWWQCRMCGMKPICHGYIVPAVNCRTCAHSTPDADGRWRCDRFSAIIPDEVEPKGCAEHIFNPYILHGVEILRTNDAENWVELRLPTGHVIIHGPRHVTSAQLAQAGALKV